MNNALQTVLGYLNLSSGTTDPLFYRGMNEAFRQYGVGQPDPLQALHSKLTNELANLHGQAAGFESIEQAGAVLRIVFQELLPAYRAFHADLLGHQTAAELFPPFFLAKACQAVLREQGPWSEDARIVAGAIAQLNNFIGHRPVATLRTTQRIEPYSHEWVCPIPLYLAGAGVGVGRYHDLIEAALGILRGTDRTILEQASFDPELLNELALDPRAYDFDHPVNKRPNYHFGQWDPHAIDNAGNYRRFVLQAVTLDALLERVDQGSAPREELLREAATVLAGIMLMAAGVSGQGPETHDSAVTLTTLLPQIAAYRDRFYQQLLSGIAGPHGDRLRAEAQTARQPFAGARHDLNQRLARLRAVQLQHVHLARLFAAMGNLSASSRQAQIVPVASARMLSEISGRVTTGHLALAHGDVGTAVLHLAEADELLRRAIQCGAAVDPWNILGFQGQFSLFPALENSVRDHRVDVLVHLITQILGLAVQTIAEAAAAGAEELIAQARDQLERLATWWDKFATLDVSGIESISGRDSVNAADAVAGALSAWRKAGATGGDIAFWRKHVTQFQSPRAYALVIETLLEKCDFVAAMGLLIQWLSEADHMPLADAEYSFHRLVVRWLAALLPAAEATRAAGTTPSVGTNWALAAKFFDYLEANAGELWEVPRLSIAERNGGAAGDDDPDDEDGDKFQAAYEDVTYLDTTDDGVEGATLSGGEAATDLELELEAARIRTHVAFLRTLARARTVAALCGHANADHAAVHPHPAADTLAEQLSHARRTERNLAELLLRVHGYRLPQPTSEHSSLVEYDRRRRIKESLLNDLVAGTVETIASVRWLAAALDTATRTEEKNKAATEGTWDDSVGAMLRGVLNSDAAGVRAAFPEFRKQLEQQPILYVPLARGGDPAHLVAAQAVKQLLMDLLVALPRLGLLAETCHLLVTAIAMERQRPRGEKAITEFDRMFEVGYRALVESVIETANVEQVARDADEQAAADAELVEALQTMTEPLLRLWLEHSRSVRLSVLERLADPERWQAVVAFIELYGHDLFTQRFMNLGSLRTILEQGAVAYLQGLSEDPDPRHATKLTEALDVEIPRAIAAEYLQTIVEAIVENFAEYKDYKTTTTQSDHGELLYTFLDSLRIKANYERVCWNIRPLVEAHETLMLRGRVGAAELWRRALAEQTADMADSLIKQFAQLGDRHQMRLPSISARLAERFIRPLAVDGLRALVKPAVEEVRGGAPGSAFAQLEHEIAEFVDQPAGSGLELPAWLAALEDEASRAQLTDADRDEEGELTRRIARVPLSLGEVTRQLREWDAPSE